MVDPRMFAHVPMAGKTRAEAKSRMLYYCEPNFEPFQGFQPGEFTFGVQQMMHELYLGKEAETGILVEPWDKSGTENRWEKMQNSDFCLITTAWGWAVSVSEAVLSECIPVVVMVRFHP